MAYWLIQSPRTKFFLATEPRPRHGQGRRIAIDADRRQLLAAGHDEGRTGAVIVVEDVPASGTETGDEALGVRLGMLEHLVFL